MKVGMGEHAGMALEGSDCHGNKETGSQNKPNSIQVSPWQSPFTLD